MRSVRGTSKGWFNLTSKKKKELQPKKPKKPMRCYEKRQDSLEDIGYLCYQDYLASDEWKKIRQRKLAHYPSCIMCGEPSCQVHHMSYDVETLLGRKDHRLVQLCRSCHFKIEFKDTKKRHLKDANRVIFEMAAQTERGQRWITWHEHQDEKWKRQMKLANRRKRR